MIKIRKGVFETNSSSVHTMTVCSPEQYEAWKNGELVFDEYTEELIPVGDVKDKFPEEYRYQTYEYYYDDYEAAEPYVENVVTPGGETIVIFGRSGYEG